MKSSAAFLPPATTRSLVLPTKRAERAGNRNIETSAPDFRSTAAIPGNHQFLASIPRGASRPARFPTKHRFVLDVPWLGETWRGQ